MRTLLTGAGGVWTWKVALQHVTLFTVFIFLWHRMYDASRQTPWDRYGSLGTCALLFLKTLPLLSLPFTLFNFLGIFLFPLKLPRINCQSSVKGFAAPFLSFRVVTRGLFPQLVIENVRRNIETCNKVALEHFQFEVVTDKEIQMPSHRHIREVVVPEDYQPQNGCKFKARALQYCLEPSVNILSDEDWIVHLDEETILTEDSVKGVFNFAAKGQFQFGQGVITYTNLGVENLLLTLADSIRVAVDYGMMRFQFTTMNIPLLSMKGSFVVANAGAERQVSWDHGPEGSIAEDGFFAIIAMSKGYKFGFIPAEMWESSPFTFGDYLKQRRRWLIGLRHLLLTSRAPWYARTGICFTVLSWSFMPLTSLGVLLTNHMDFASPPIDFLTVPIAINYAFMLFLGTALSFTPRRIGWAKYLGYVALTILAFPVLAVGENLAAISVWFQSQLKFDIVQKEKDDHVTSKDNRGTSIDSDLIQVI